MSSTSLLYEEATYRSVYGNEFIAEFNHGPFAKGVVEKEKALKIVADLNAAQKDSVVSFNPAMVTTNQLEGGACSVVSLKVAKAAFGIIESLQKAADLTVEHKARILSHKLGQFVMDIHNQGQSNKKGNEEARKEIRTIQHAFNTITVDRSKTVAHVVKEKVNALAAFFGLKVKEATPEEKVSGNSNLKAYIEKHAQELPEGIYLIRVIDFKNNHKLENCGHSITYIKSFNSELYFDPRLGFYQLFPRKENLIYNALLSAQLQFKVDFVSFHKLEGK